MHRYNIEIIWCQLIRNCRIKTNQTNSVSVRNKINWRNLQFSFERQFCRQINISTHNSIGHLKSSKGHPINMTNLIAQALTNETWPFNEMFLSGSLL